VATNHSAVRVEAWEVRWGRGTIIDQLFSGGGWTHQAGGGDEEEEEGGDGAGGAAGGGGAIAPREARGHPPGSVRKGWGQARHACLAKGKAEWAGGSPLMVCMRRVRRWSGEGMYCHCGRVRDECTHRNENRPTIFSKKNIKF